MPPSLLSATSHALEPTQQDLDQAHQQGDSGVPVTFRPEGYYAKEGFREVRLTDLQITEAGE